jgi:transposase InsO family protein
MISRWTSVSLLRFKSKAFEAYCSLAAWVRTQKNVEIKCLHADRGGEYLSETFINYLEKHGTERKLTVHDTPEENGVAERLNRTLMEKAHAMMITAQVPIFLWGEAVFHAVWLKNRTWTRVLQSPLDHWT